MILLKKIPKPKKPKSAKAKFSFCGVEAYVSIRPGWMRIGLL